MSEKGSRSYRKDALIYIESDEESDEVFVVEAGEVSLTGTPGIPRFRTALGPGDIFGFTSCCCRRPRMETAVARTECACLALERERFIESVQANPELAGRIISYFAQELRAYDDMMATPSDEASAADEEAHLYALARHLFEKGKPAHACHALEVYCRGFPKGMHAAEAAKSMAALRQKGVVISPPVQRGLCRVYPDGQMIFCEYEPGDELYIIKSGKVEIRKIAPPEEILLSILREGDIFGELSIVSSAPRSAAALSIGETVLLPVSRASLQTVFQKSPAMVGRILAALSQRLWFTFMRVRSRVYENPITRTYVLLENKLLEDRVSLSSAKPYTLPLGMGEILGMAGIPASQVDAVKGLLVDDSNLTFQFRQLTVESPSALEAKARYYRTRDHLDSPGLKQASRKGTPGRIGLDLHELRVPPETIPES
ncbi:MAG: cyclic nucleotide-binding domain-containing protein [Spirochaetia bacterium]|jgi:CRP-like cAMP-binding protein